MSISTYRSTIERIQRDIADLEKRRSQENAKIAKLRSDISSIERSINKDTTASSLQMKKRQIEAKLKSIAQAQSKVADYSKKIADKTGQMNRVLQNLERAEAQERKKVDAAEKKRRDEELR